MQGSYRSRPNRQQATQIRSKRDRDNGLPKYCSQCGKQLLFGGRGHRRVFEDEQYGTAGRGKCWGCYRVVLRNGGV